MDEQKELIEQSILSAYPRVMAQLLARGARLADAEDAMAFAREQALIQWYAEVIPDSPAAWLYRVALNSWIDSVRKQTRSDGEVTMDLIPADALFHELPEERLRLMFLCVQPIVPRDMRVPLTLQVGFGLSADRIASLFLDSPLAMRKRLTRVKSGLQQNQVSFELPNESVLTQQLPEVLDALYGLYAIGWEDDIGAQSGLWENSAEALHLSRVVAAGFESAEAMGLCALIGFMESRRAARRSADGVFIPMDEQDIGLWKIDLIEESEMWLRRASELNTVGRYQLEAAIQSAHVIGRIRNEVDWTILDHLYEQLYRLNSSLGVYVAAVAVKRKLLGAEVALEMLDRLSEQQRNTFLPAVAVRGHCQRDLGDLDGARKTFAKALALSSDRGLREYFKTLMN